MSLQNKSEVRTQKPQRSTKDCVTIAMSGTSDSPIPLANQDYLPGRSVLVAMAELIFTFPWLGLLMTIYQNLISVLDNLLSTIALHRFLTAHALE